PEPGRAGAGAALAGQAGHVRAPGAGGRRAGGWEAGGREEAAGVVATAPAGGAAPGGWVPAPPAALGAVGAVTVLFVVLIQVCALYTAIVAHRGTVSVLVACMASRLAITLACAGRHPAGLADDLSDLPRAVASGPAEGGPARRVVVGPVSPPAALLAVVVAIGLAALAGRLDYDGGDPSRALRAVFALAAATAVGLLVRRYLTRRFAGLSEPVLGALVELTTAVALVSMAFTVPYQIQNALNVP
ncbi:adenosylcobinamide-GDP ribazoletransferase, partial [Frankia nepalensis]